MKEIPNDKKIATTILSNINTFCLFKLSSGFIGLFFVQILNVTNLQKFKYKYKYH